MKEMKPIMVSGNGRSTLLKVEDLVTRFYTPEGVVHAVNGVSFDLAEGETLGVVGESGCGKSVTMLSILQLIARPPGKIESGHAWFDGQDLLNISTDQIRDVRGSRPGRGKTLRHKGRSLLRGAWPRTPRPSAARSLRGPGR